MKIIIEQLDDVYFFLADKTEKFGCKYHHEGKEVILITIDSDGSAHLYDPETNSLQRIEKEYFERDYNILGHPIYLGQLTDIMNKRINELYILVTDDEFARYVFLAKQIVNGWTIKANPIEGACISEYLFNNMIKMLGDFFEDPGAKGFKAGNKKEEIQEITDGLSKEVLSRKNKDKGMKSKKN